MTCLRPSKFQNCSASLQETSSVTTIPHCMIHVSFRNPRFVVVPLVHLDTNGNEINSRNFQVKNIYVPCEYYGLEGNYASDIALIELREPFQLSDILSPACLDVLGNNDQILEAGSVGKFAGFGRTSRGASSAVLLSANIPYVSFSQCRMSQTGDGNVALIGKDKFCGGTIDGEYKIVFHFLSISFFYMEEYFRDGRLPGRQWWGINLQQRGSLERHGSVER